MYVDKDKILELSKVTFDALCLTFLTVCLFLQGGLYEADALPAAVDDACSELYGDQRLARYSLSKPSAHSAQDEWHQLADSSQSTNSTLFQLNIPLCKSTLGSPKCHCNQSSAPWYVLYFSYPYLTYISPGYSRSFANLQHLDKTSKDDNRPDSQMRPPKLLSGGLKQ